VAARADAMINVLMNFGMISMFLINNLFLVLNLLLGITRKKLRKELAQALLLGSGSGATLRNRRDRDGR
jgi:hypothetical protein